MKKIKVLFLFILSATILFATRPKIIENPSCEVKNTGIYSISKIELAKKQTRIFVKCTFIPYWWVMFKQNEVTIKDVDTGETFHPITIENGKFDTKISMPASGDSTFIFDFPLLGKKVRKIDFIFSDGQILGVSLEKMKLSLPFIIYKNINENWLTNEIEKSPKKSLIDYNSDAFFAYDSARLVGYIKGYDPRLGFSTGLIYMENVISRDNYPIVLQIDSTGRFDLKIPIIHPIYHYISIKNQIVKFYIEQGQTLGMVLDWNDFLMGDRQRNVRYEFTNTKYLGALGKINDDLIGFKAQDFNYSELQKKMETLTLAEFKNEEQKRFELNQTKLREYADTCSLLPQTSTLLKEILLLDNANIQFNFVSSRDYFASKDTTNKFLKQEIPDSYFNFISSIPLNNKSLLVSSKFSEFINRFEYCAPFSKAIPKSKEVPEKNFTTFLVEKNVRIPEKDKQLFSKINQWIETAEGRIEIDKNKIEINALYEKYKTYRQEYIDTYLKPLRSKPNLTHQTERWNFKDTILTNVLHLESNLTYEIAKIRSLKYDLKNMNSNEATEYWETFKTGIKTQFLLNEGDKQFETTFPIVEKNAYELPESEGTRVFKKVIDPFKGKILFVDFWATTCGPCVANIKKMKTIREKYKDNPDFEFIFITDMRASPEEDYKKFIAEQELKNTFRLKQDEFNYLRQLFRFNGIPHYIIVDKEGKIQNDDYSMYLFEKDLPKILKK